MKDLNFFSSYSRKKDKRINKDYLIYGIILLFSFSMIFYGTINYFKIRKLNIELFDLEKKVEEVESNKKIKEILNRENGVGELKANIAGLKTLDEYVDRIDIINEDLLFEVENSIPSNVFLKTMVLNYDLIRIEGKSQDKESIAQFQHNLENLDAFDEVFVPQISYNENHYSFSMDIKFKEEEKADESETE